MPNESEDQELIDQVREIYGAFLEKPENTDLANRLSALSEKYRRVAEMEVNAEANPFVGLDRENLLMEAETELEELSSQIKEVYELNLSPSERRLFEGRTQGEIDEMQELMKQWSPATYADVAASLLDHSFRKNYEPLDYLRNASRFDKSKAVRIPRLGSSEVGTVRWEIRSTGEYLIETPEGKTVTYGFNN
ncbi:hypothetical protein [Coleofasciculus sp. H7-2]|uniref:hypothetical protein n=1 Tax=Coleofasciculus sp. H7-2 TaxID=3351545 RepID=UPI00366FE883